MEGRAMLGRSRAASLGERGAAAVEMLIVFPILFALFVGIVDFGAAFNAQISLTQATREGVRVGAIGDNRTVPAMQTRLREAYGGVGGNEPSAVVGQSNGCSSDINTGSARLTAELQFDPPLNLLGEFVGPITLRARAEMRCGG